MAILNDGDIYSGVVATAVANPRFTLPDESDEDDFGAISLVVDDNMSDQPDQLKARFYGWYNRIQVTAFSALSVEYTGATVLLPDGTTEAISDGTLILPASSTRFVYVNDAGVVTSAPTLPNTCLPLAVVTTDASEVTSIVDLRYQIIDQVKPISLPTAVSPWRPGDTKETYATTLESGWLWADGSLVNVADYPALFAAIGYTHGGSGAQFRLPDRRGRVAVGAGQGAGLTNRVMGQTGGAESRSVPIPRHNHGVNESPHIHGVNEAAHTHSTIDSTHNHAATQSTHSHTIVSRRTEGSGTPFIGRSLVYSDNTFADPWSQETAQGLVPFQNIANTTGVVIQSTKTNVSLQSAKTNLSVNFAGSADAAIDVMQPFSVCNVMIRAI